MGCVLPQAPDTRILPVNRTAAAIGIALNDTSVRTYLTGSWRVMDVKPDAQVTLPRDGVYVTVNTPDVMIETESDVVHAYVDLTEKTVVHIWVQEKRAPVSGTT
jgi:hypothetical protein